MTKYQDQGAHPKHTGLGWILAGLLLLIAALALILGNLWEDKQAGRAADEAIKQLKPIVTQTIQSETSPDSDVPGNSSLDEIQKPIQAYEIDPTIPMPTETVENRDYIGILEIPAVDIELPILSKWSYPNLKVSPCRFTGSVYTNDMILCGHDYSTHFRPLRNMQSGEKVTFTDIDGNSFVYTVDYIETINGKDMEGLTAGEWDLSLFTCTTDGAARVVVRCVEIDEND